MGDEPIEGTDIGLTPSETKEPAKDPLVTVREAVENKVKGFDPTALE